MSEAGYPPPRRLDSWKEIADYLGRDVRTVIRWGQTKGLPVRRVAGGKARAVFAYTQEIDAWLTGAGSGTETLPPAPQAAPAAPAARHAAWSGKRLASVIAATAVLAIGSVAATGYWHRVQLPAVATIGVRGGALEAFDAQGALVWRSVIPGVPSEFTINPTNGRVFALDGNRATDVVATMDVIGPDGVTSGVLTAFGPSGAQRWQQSLNARVTFGDTIYEAPWNTNSVAVYRVGGAARVAWASHHHTWWPGIVEVFDKNGLPRGRFVNAGWIVRLEATPDGRYLLAAGVSNSRDGVVLAVLDAAHVDGTSPEEPGSPFACRDCPAGRPVAYFVVPWSDIAHAGELPVMEPEIKFSATGTIELHAPQLIDALQSPEMILEVSPSLEVVRSSVSDSFWAWHERLEREGRLKHRAAQDPFRSGFAVTVWTPKDGWRTIGPHSPASR